MDKLAQAFFSMRSMAIALFVFLIAIAAATFIESRYDTETARLIVYNAIWFELLLAYLCINLLANIFTYKMFSREKIAMLMFHLAFIIMIIGAAVTRYMSFEGAMIIDEGTKSNILYNATPSFWVRINDGKKQFTWDEEMYMSEFVDNEFSISCDALPESKPRTITVEYVDYRKNLVDSLIEDAAVSTTTLDIVTNGMSSNYLTQGGFLTIGDAIMSFDDPDANSGIQLKLEGSKVMVQTDRPMRYLPMAEMRKMRQSGIEAPDSMYHEVKLGEWEAFQSGMLYQTESAQFVFKRMVKNSEVRKIKSPVKGQGTNYLTVRVNDGEDSRLVDIAGGKDIRPTTAQIEFKGLIYDFEYGARVIELPFFVECIDFRMDRYPGSESPSSFESDLAIYKDEAGQPVRSSTIFMNNVLDYEGYRFFQSGYKPDESGTILSANHDWWGTNISYLGYLMMSIGMLMALFAPAGRTRELVQLVSKSIKKREKVMTVLLALALSTSSTFAIQDTIPQEDAHAGHDHSHEGHDHSAHAHEAAPEKLPQVEKLPHYVMDVKHSEELASLITLDFDGRFAPMHTICDKLLRKVYKKSEFEGKNAVQTIFAVHMYSWHWKTVDMIYVSSKGGWRDKFDGDKYVSYDDLTGEDGNFLFMEEYQKAHQKKESKRGEPEKELIRLNERYFIMQQMLSGQLQHFRIIPNPNDPSGSWIQLHPDIQDTDGFKLGATYLQMLYAADAGDKSYADALKALNDLKDHQRQASKKEVPAKALIDMEISYNKMNIFKNAAYGYLLFGFVVLIFYFIGVFTVERPKLNKIVKYITYTFVALTAIVSLYHGYGIYMRWAITGRAPWSNAYEAIVFIAFITSLVGAFFIRRQALIFGAAAILSFLMLFVSELNVMDPEITTLQPVLKSYWLMIHVAIITGSYGPLGISCILGLMNLILYAVRGRKQTKRMTMVINEVTWISEITMTIGIFMLTIGTFLGGVWANESWGRYWGWDPKETWALVAILVYAVILHLRYIPSLKDKFTFNVLSFWGYSSILFTFFGVNYMLVGMHSYAQGDAVGFPEWLNYFILGMYVFTEFAWARNKMRSLEGNFEIKPVLRKIGIMSAITLLTMILTSSLEFITMKEAVAYSIYLISVFLTTNLILYFYIQYRLRAIQQ